MTHRQYIDDEGGHIMKRLYIAKAILLSMLVSACSEQNSIEDILLTEAAEMGATTSYISKEDVIIGKELYLVSNNVRVRSSADLSSKDNILGKFIKGDKVKVLGEPEGIMVQVELLDIQAKLKTSENYYVAYKYLTEATVSRGPDWAANPTELSDIFMVQNIATEKLRVYKKSCESGICKHKMIFEADFVSGEDAMNEDGKGSTRSVVGHFRVSSWIKFYMDQYRRYPSWDDPNYPALPEPGAGVTDWLSNDDILPGYGTYRGAFGWYTAKVGPDAHMQWTHGTYGWGADGNKFIEETRGFWANLFADPRSHGCSRVSNEHIAFIRELLPIGSSVIKIYAREAYADPNLSNYTGSEKGEFDYILTKNGVRRDGQKAGRDTVLKAGTPSHQYLEEGTLHYKRIPEANVFLSGRSGKDSGWNGNVYGLKHEDMKGVFLVDEGRILKYAHPTHHEKIGRGGFRNIEFPNDFIAASNTAYSLPKCPRRYLPSAGGGTRRPGSGSAIKNRQAGRCAPQLDSEGRYSEK